MKEFDNISEFIAHLSTLAEAEKAALQRGLQECAEAVEKTAKAEFDGSQSAAGPFPVWPALAPATLTKHQANDEADDSPLSGSGVLRDSISHQVHGLTASVGSNSAVMAYQELGTDKIPPRPVLGPSLVRNRKLIERTLGRAAAQGLLHGSGMTFGL